MLYLKQDYNLSITCLQVGSCIQVAHLLKGERDRVHTRTTCTIWESSFLCGYDQHNKEHVVPTLDIGYLNKFMIYTRSNINKKKGLILYFVFIICTLFISCRMESKKTIDTNSKCAMKWLKSMKIIVPAGMLYHKVLYVLCHLQCIVPENIHTPPTEGIGNSQ